MTTPEHVREMIHFVSLLIGGMSIFVLILLFKYLRFLRQVPQLATRYFRKFESWLFRILARGPS